MVGIPKVLFDFAIGDGGEFLWLVSVDLKDEDCGALQSEGWWSLSVVPAYAKVSPHRLAISRYDR